MCDLGCWCAGQEHVAVYAIVPSIVSSIVPSLDPTAPPSAGKEGGQGGEDGTAAPPPQHENVSCKLLSYTCNNGNAAMFGGSTGSVGTASPSKCSIVATALGG